MYNNSAYGLSTVINRIFVVYNNQWKLVYSVEALKKIKQEEIIATKSAADTLSKTGGCSIQNHIGNVTL